MKELAVPPLAHKAHSHEVLRVWTIPDGGQQCVLQCTWDDPGSWGLLIVDIARHAARAYAASGTISEQEALRRIKLLFDAEWAAPSDAGRRVLG